MSDADAEDPLERRHVRREPPPLIAVTVAARIERSPRLLRLTFEGPAIHLLAAEPAASVRLLVPTPGTDELVIPTWNGNEFLLPGAIRPSLRTFTPLGSDPTADRLDLEIVRHPGGAVSEWAEACGPGSPAALSGPGRGYEIDLDASTFHLLGDETAMPAIAQLLETLPLSATVDIHLEVDTDAAIVALPEHPGATVTWHPREPDARPSARLVAAAANLDEIDASTQVWAAGEAAAMQAIRKKLKERGVPRAQATIRGYWKPERR